MLIRSEIEKMVKDTWVDKAGEKVMASEKIREQAKVSLTGLSISFSFAKQNERLEEELLKRLKTVFLEQLVSIRCCDEIIEMCITRMAEYEVELDSLKSKLESNAVAIENTPVANEHVE